MAHRNGTTPHPRPDAGGGLVRRRVDNLNRVDNLCMADEPEIVSSPPAVRDILGVPVHAVTMAQVCQICEHAVLEGRPLRIGVANAAKVVKMRQDDRLRRAVTGSDLVLADGASLVWASRILGAPLPERVTGIDLFFELLALADRRGSSVYFLGATADVLAKLVEKVRVDYPNVVIAGFRDGYFGDEECKAVAAEVAVSAPDFLFLGMGTPKKELFLADWAPHTLATVSHGVGGTFDVYAGKVKRAPGWMQRVGLEWFYRVLQEPRRMSKRYLVTNTRFVMLLVSALCGRMGGRGILVPGRDNT